MLTLMKVHYSILLAMMVFCLLVFSCGNGGASGAPGGPDGSGSSNPASPGVSASDPDGGSAGGSQTGNSATNLSPEEQEKLRLASIDPARPQFSLASRISKSAVTVSLSCPTPEAKIAYTLDGSEPKPGKSKDYSGSLTISSSSIIRAMAYIPGGKQSKPVEADYTIGEICVGKAANGDGTRSRPFSSLKAGLEAATSLGITTLKIAGGQYPGSVVLQSKLQISGGWSKAFTKRGAEKTILIGDSLPGVSKSDPGYAVKISGSDTAELKLERLEIRGGEASYSCALLVSAGATPSLSNCQFQGGSGSYGYGAIVIGAAAPSFSSCQFDGGASPSSIGLSIDSAQAKLYSCVAAAGSGNVTASGASLTDSKINAYNSVFAGSAANTSTGISLWNSKSSVIEGCTLWGGSGRQATALFISVSNPAVSSSIIAAAGKKESYGIYHNYGGEVPAFLKNCLFTGCESALYFDADTRIAYINLADTGKFISAAGKPLAAIATSASLFLPLDLGPTPLCKTPAELVPGIAGGGLISTVSAIDLAGRKRTEPATIGAYEIDR